MEGNAGEVQQGFHGNFGSTLHGLCLILWPPWMNHAYSGKV